MVSKLWKVVFVLGGPGVGKGTQCARIVKEFGWEHLSAGDLLRAERQTGSSDAQLIDSYLREGRIVPVEITVGLIRKAMEKSATNRFLIDGFPRNQDNVNGWQSVVGDAADVLFVLNFVCDEATCVARVLERGKTSGRTDDNETTIKNRLRSFRDETQPIVDLYEQQGKVRTIDGMPAPDEVWEKVRPMFASISD